MSSLIKPSIISWLTAFILQGCMAPGQDTESLLPARPGETVRVSTEHELHSAIREAEPDQTIIIEDGVYQLTREVVIDGKYRLTIRGASADASRVVLKAGGWGDYYNNREAFQPNNAIVIVNSDDITIADLTIAEASLYGIKLEAGGDNVRFNPSNINILRCNFMNIAVRAIKGTASRNQEHLVGGSVRFCRFENTKTPESSWLFNGNYVSSIDMMYLRDWTFSDNVFYNIRGAGGGGRGAIFIWNQSRNIIAERNIFVGCDRSISFGNPSEPTLWQPGTLHNYDGIIRNNFIVSERGTGIEVIWADNVQVYHNTILGPDLQFRGIRYLQKISRLHIANNLVQGRIIGEDAKAQMDGNYTGNLDGYFISPAVGNLRLTAHAVNAMGKGIPLPPVQYDIDGMSRKTPPDPGAHEFQQNQ